MTVRSALVLLALALASGCADDHEAPAPASADPVAGRSLPTLDSDAPQPSEVRPGVLLDRLLDARSDDAPVLASLRTPRSRRAVPTPNEHVEGQTDSVRTYVYDGMEIEAYEVQGGRTFIRQIEVTSGQYGTVSGLSVGETRADIEAILGVPFEEEGAVAAYVSGSDLTPTTVEVDYEPDRDGTDRATAIRWIPYLD